MALSPTRQKQYDRIVATAAELFQRDGIAQTPMNKVAKEAGVDRKTLYNYFATKEGLAEAVSIALSSHIPRDFTINASDSGFDQVSAALTHMYEALKGEEVFLRYSALFDYFDKDQPILIGARTLDQLTQTPLYQAIVKGLQDGSIRDTGERPEQLLAALIIPFFSGLQKAMHRKAVLASAYQLEIDILATHLSIVLRGLRNEPRASS